VCVVLEGSRWVRLVEAGAGAGAGTGTGLRDGMGVVSAGRVG
jgi:hypothetical protein